MALPIKYRRPRAGVRKLTRYNTFATPVEPPLPEFPTQTNWRMFFDGRTGRPLSVRDTQTYGETREHPTQSTVPQFTVGTFAAPGEFFGNVPDYFLHSDGLVSAYNGLYQCDDIQDGSFYSGTDRPNAAVWQGTSDGTVEILADADASLGTEEVAAFVDGSGAGNDLEQQLSGGAAPRFTYDNDSLTVVTEDALLALDTNVPLTITGAFDAWFVFSRAAASIVGLAGQGSSTNNAIVPWSDDVLYVTINGSGVNRAFTATGTILLHVWRTAGNDVRSEWTGVAEASMGSLAGSMVLNQIGVVSNTTTAVGNAISSISIAETSISAGQRTAILSYFSEVWGVTL